MPVGAQPETEQKPRSISVSPVPNLLLNLLSNLLSNLLFAFSANSKFDSKFEFPQGPWVYSKEKGTKKNRPVQGRHGHGHRLAPIRVSSIEGGIYSFLKLYPQKRSQYLGKSFRNKYFTLVKLGILSNNLATKSILAMFG